MSKGFGLINRFSEDVDVTVFRDDLGKPATIEELDALSGKKRRARRNAIKYAYQAYVSGPLHAELTLILEDRLQAAGLDADAARVEADDDDPDGQSLLIWYPAATPRSDCVRAAIKIEAGAKSAFVPNSEVPIRPYVDDDLPGLDLTVQTVRTVDPERTFWDKVVILHGLRRWFDTHGALRGGGQRVSRHYYDLHQLASAPVGAAAIAQPTLGANCIAHARMFSGTKSPPPSETMSLTMSKNKPTPGGRGKKKAEVSLVRSSAAEYLTFVAASGQGGVEAVYADENVWLTQKMMGLLYDVETHTVNYHLKQIFADGELQAGSVIRKFRITAADGKTYDTQHYHLAAIIAVGYKVNSERAVQFRKWATGIIESFTIKGFAMDDERLKNDGSILGKKYFEEQLQRIREIRLSERKFYQKITDIYATSIGYDITAAATKRFFATVQNKLHWAIHGQTAAEVIISRADAAKDRMGLTTWKDAPKGKIQKFDVGVAKNYLTLATPR